MTKIISTLSLATLLGGIALSPAYAQTDAYKRDAYRGTPRGQSVLTVPAPTGPVIEGRNVYMAPPADAVEPYIRRSEESDRRSK